MKNPNIVQEKAYAYAIRIVLFCRSMMEDREYVLSKQLLRSGTGVGANIEEAQRNNYQFSIINFQFT
ncbi:MAG: four helix bundle protein [Candidatus Peribacteraceae bacterium]